MTTRQRLDLLARAYPRLFPRTELLHLVRDQLGHIDALDSWIKPKDSLNRIRAHAPKLLYHICAGNLAVSAYTSLAHGLLLGAQNIVKLPGDRDDTTTRRDILRFIAGLPAPLRRLIKTHRELDSKTFAQADVVIAFGSDATMASLRAQIRWDQKFIPHGHALSLLWLSHPNRLTPTQARACATDVLTYDQLGCLSPQAIYVPSGTNITKLGTMLSEALETEWQKADSKPHRPLATAARIAEARDLAYARGHVIWLPSTKHLGWTLIHDPDPTFRPSPLHGIIYLRQSAESKLTATLSCVAGRISTIGVAGQLSSRLKTAFLSLGVSRFCPAGRMQFPPLTWHHEGRPVLGDLVTWSDFEGTA